MADENKNPVLAYAEARMAAWAAVVVSVKTALALDPGGQTIEGIDLPASTQNGDPIDLPEGAFLGKSIPACIKLFLSAAKKKKAIKEIAAALKEGGVESTGNFQNVVTGALNRLKTAGEVLRFKDGWGLPEWYPAHIRAAAPTNATGKHAKRKSKTKKVKSSANSAAEQQSKAGAPQALKPANERIYDVLRSGKKAEYDLAEIATDIGMGVFGTRLIIGKMVKAGKVEKTANQTYRIPQPKLVAASV